MSSICIESLSVLSSDYEYCDKIGSGKFGSVYKVIYKETGCSYAAKHVECRRASEKKRLLEEVEILGSLDHPQIMRLHRVFGDTEAGFQDEIFLILEYLSGGYLYSRVMNSEEALTETDVSGFIKQILLGLAYIHSKDIVHLDIKPENIVCETGGSFNIKLVDFGLARRLSDSKDICVMQGTPDFVSPEVISFEPVSSNSDMWSVGVITYVLLSGLSPFLGNSKAETYSNITSGNYTLDEDQFDVVSTEGKDFIENLLLLEPSKRMTAEESLQHSWIRDGQSTRCGQNQASHARLRWNKYGNTIRAVNRFRGVER